MSVKLVSVTPDAEQTMAYVARVSNPNNQENPNYAKLLGYCIKHNHWSVFEQAFMTLEIETTRGLALKCCATVRLHIKSFHNDMLILPYSRRRFLSRNFGHKTPRIVKIVLMMLTPLRSRNMR